MDLSYAKRLSDFVLEIIRKGWVKSAHDCSEGGLAVALAECCMSNGNAMVGASIDLSALGVRPHTVLFGETQSRIIVSCAPAHLERIVNGPIPVTILGTTGGYKLKIKLSRHDLSWDLARLREVWWNAIGRLMDA